MTPTTIDRPARRRLTSGEKRSLLRTLGFVVFLHVLGWGLLVGVVAPHNYQVGGSVLGVGLGVTAYTFGLRHAVDADHIAAIDNTTRKLMEDGKRPVASASASRSGTRRSSSSASPLSGPTPSSLGITDTTPRPPGDPGPGAPRAAAGSCCSSASSTWSS